MSDLGVLEHVAHVEVAGDVGRWEQHGEGVRAHARSGSPPPSGAWMGHPILGRCGDLEEALADPVVGPALLDGGGVVGLGEGAVGGIGGGCCGLLLGL